MENKKSRTKTVGVYKIINGVNQKYYVGSSDDIVGTGGRWDEHKNDLKANRHANRYLQRAWNKYGENNFSFEIVELTEKSLLLEIEQVYLDIAEKEQDKCYNLKFIAGGGGRFSEKTIQKLRESKLGNKNPNFGKSPSLITKNKMSHSHKGLKNGRCDIKIYTFENSLSKERFTGTRVEFVIKYNLNRGCVKDVVYGNQKQTKNWYLILS